jgi:hypothetical protein
VRNVLQCSRNERGGAVWLLAGVLKLRGLRRRVQGSVCIMTR